METYFSKIPLDLRVLIVSSLTIDKIDEFCSFTETCDPSFWDALYRIKFNKRPPENSEKWFDDQLKEYRNYLITGDANLAIDKMAESGMINEVRTILNHIGLEWHQIRNVLESAAKGGHQNIIDLIFELYATKLDDAIYQYGFYGAIEGGHKDLMDLFRSLMKTDLDYITSAWYASHSGNSEMFKKFIEHSIDRISSSRLRTIVNGLIGHEDLFYWFIKKYSDKLSNFSKDDYIGVMSQAALRGTVGMFDTLLNISNQVFTPDDYMEPMESAIYNGHEKMIKKLLSLGAGKSKRGYVEWMITAAKYNKYDIFVWMIYLGKDEITQEDYQNAFDNTSDDHIKYIIQTYFLKSNE